jgi:hypothetical protein
MDRRDGRERREWVDMRDGRRYFRREWVGRIVLYPRAQLFQNFGARVNNSTSCLFWCRQSYVTADTKKDGLYFVTVEIISQHHKEIIGITINHFSSSESHERHGSSRLFLSLVALMVLFQLCRTWMQRPARWGCCSHRRRWCRRAAPPCCSVESFDDAPRAQGVRDLKLILHSDGATSSSSSMA